MARRNQAEKDQTGQKNIWIMMAVIFVLTFILIVTGGAYFKKSSAYKQMLFNKNSAEQETEKYRSLYLELNSGARSASLSVDQAKDAVAKCNAQMVLMQGEIDSMQLMLDTLSTQ